MGKFRIFVLALAVFVVPFSLAGNNLAFIFQSNGTTASVYDADSLQQVAGSPVTVGLGAVKAFGAPNLNTPNQLSKIYVVTSSSVVVLDPITLAVRKTLSLPGTLSPAPNSAALSGDGRYLLVAAGSQVTVISTQDASDSTITQIPTLSPPLGIVVLPNSRRAYVTLNTSPVIQIIDLNVTPPGLTSVTANLPPGVFASSIGIAPNGSRIYVTASTGLYEIDRVNNNPVAIAFGGATGIAFDPDAPVPSAVLNAGINAPILNLSTRLLSPFPFNISGNPAITKVVLPGFGRAMLLAGNPGHVYEGLLSAGGLLTEYSNPQNGLPLGPNAVDMDVSPDGSKVFVAFSDGKFIRVDPTGVLPATLVTTPNSSTSVALVYAPLTAATLLEIYGGDQQSLGLAPPPLTLPAPLAVRARAGNFPVFGMVVNFNPLNGGVQNDTPVITNLQGVAESQATLTLSSPLQVQANLPSGGNISPVTFNLNGGVNSSSLLNKISGDYQLAVQNSAFPFSLTVQGAPNTMLAIFVSDSTKVSCNQNEAPITTDITGTATFLCHALGVTATAEVTINVTDPFGNTLPDAFHATIVRTSADLPTQFSLSLQPGFSLFNVPVQQVLTNALSASALKADGSPSPTVGVVFTSAQGVTFNPILAVTSSGVATTSLTIGCTVGTGSITATFQSPNAPTATIGFNALAGPIGQVLKRQGDGQSGNAGQRLPQALVVETTDACGNPLSGQPVTWAVTSGSATLQNIVGATDFRGDASVIVQLGNSAGPVIVTATSGSFSASFTLAVNLVASQLVITAGNNQTVAVGQQAPQSLTVAVQDANGSGVPGIAVTFSVSSGPGTVATSQTTSDSTGHASTTLTAGATPGTISILASAVGKTVTFTVTSVGRTPIVSTVGFVNGASFQPGWVPGSTGSIFGTGLSEGVNGVVLANQAPFPTILQGVQVRVQGVLAPIIALANVNGQEQINIQVPFEVTAPSSVTVVITNNGASATFTGIPTLSVQPGVFQFNSNGTQLAAALHANFNVITQADPAKAGETIMLFLTGMGATNPAVSTNVAGPVSTLASTTVSPLVVTVNNQSAKVIGSWYAPFLYTAYQINLVIPPGTTSGLATVIVNAAGSASPAVKIPIQ